jgi:hypothetical protein
MDVGRGEGEKGKIRQGDTKNVEEEEKEKEDTRYREHKTTGF